jgi:hypothetical protein
VVPGILAARVLEVREAIAEHVLICDGEREAIEVELGRAGCEHVASSPASLDEIFFARTGSGGGE